MIIALFLVVIIAIIILVLAVFVFGRKDRETKPHKHAADREEAKPHEHPHQVALVSNNSKFCGGSIIDPITILTAAHCVDGATSVAVVAGAHNISQKESTQQTQISSHIKKHPDWDGENNDVALILLSKHLEYNDQVQPIELYDGQETLEGQLATVSGWGNPTPYPCNNVLLNATNSIIANTKCGYLYEEIVRPSVLCLSAKDGQGSRKGDSGGPLILRNNGKKQIVGIVSKGHPTNIKRPTSYSRISFFKKWINENRKNLKYH